ncbi:MAG: hypothetical protein KAJ75_07825 [Alphaproteobacteria bacterium]|nr:hypothetical protein [Alphaproteobacteria bacterium]
MIEKNQKHTVYCSKWAKRTFFNSSLLHNTSGLSSFFCKLSEETRNETAILREKLSSLEALQSLRLKKLSSRLKSYRNQGIFWHK